MYAQLLPKRSLSVGARCGRGHALAILLSEIHTLTILLSKVHAGRTSLIGWLTTTTILGRLLTWGTFGRSAVLVLSIVIHDGRLRTQEGG